MEDVRQRLRVRRFEDVGERREREADGQDEEDAEEASNRDTVDRQVIPRQQNNPRTTPPKVPSPPPAN